MSLADTIGFVLVCFAVLIFLVWVSIEARWRLQQRVDFLRAQTEEKKRQFTMQQIEKVASRGGSTPQAHTVLLGATK